MSETIAADRGVVYSGYSDAVAWISALPEHELGDFIVRMGQKPRPGLTLQQDALGLVRDEYSDRTLSSRIVRVTDETVYDRDPRALAVMERVLADMEAMTSGYAFEQHPVETQAAVRTAIDLALAAASAASASDLHAYHRALDQENDHHFDHDADYRIAASLEEALAHFRIEDTTDLRLRYLGGRDGFLSEAAYQEMVRTEMPMRQAVSRAAEEHWRRFREACGRFDVQRARESFLKTGDARYYDLPYVPADAEVTLRQRAFHAELSRKLSASESFRRSEREQGYSPYGYWFAPDGTVHAMHGFQIHDTWIRGTLEGGPGIREGRYEALAAGWVSMTMMDEKCPGANIAYGQGAACQRALKAAARIIRRGGEFGSVVIEAYDGMEPAGYEFHDDPKHGARRLNGISSEASPAPKP